MRMTVDESKITALFMFMDRLIRAEAAGYHCSREIAAVIRAISDELGLMAVAERGV